MLDSPRRSSTKTETKVSLQDFRCFHQVSEIPLRPINILVGENGTGKSSFLAAVRFLLELTQRTTKASFNKDPFFLGSYEQIAHYRGGRFGRAKTFSFTMRGAIDKEFVLRRVRPFVRDQQNIPARLPDEFEIRFTFHNNRSQPAIYKVDFEAGLFAFSFRPCGRI
jgi:AAA ATPase domain